MVSGDSRECLENLIGCEDEEELLKQAIALSMEGADETENGENKEDNNQQEDGEEGEEELLLRQAIALSLEGAEEEDD